MYTQLTTPADSNAAKAAEKALKLREEERRGRIRAEKTIRELLAAPTADSGDTMQVRPIAKVVSPIQGRWGTPRQGLLCPSLRGVIVFKEGTPREALTGITEFSHCWLVWNFHENTNTRKERAGGRKGQGLGVPALVSPPGLYGERRGVFATRSPHRPNAIGLSLVRVEGTCTVDASVDVHGQISCKPQPGKQRRCRLLALVVRGSDLIHGTPILDIKPYLGPGLDAPIPASDSREPTATAAAEPRATAVASSGAGAEDTGGLELPGWVSSGRLVQWRVGLSAPAAEALEAASRGGKRRPGKWIEAAAAYSGEPLPRVSGAVGAIHGGTREALAAASEVLALDPRGVRMGRGQSGGTISRVEVTVDGLAVKAEFGERVTITDLAPTAETAKLQPHKGPQAE
jgi:tRNA (Thr-GGU) A37 N-methylase